VKSNLTLLFVLLFSLFSCSKEQDRSPRIYLDSSVIIGKINWKDLNTKTNAPARVIKLKNGVGRLSVHEKGLYCSAFLISKNLILTNYHCLPHTEGFKDIEVTFNYEKGEAWQDSTYLCDELIADSSIIDYGILKCEGRPGERFPILKLAEDDSHIRILRKAFIIHHNCDFINAPDCLPFKKLSPGRILSQNSFEVTHNADTLAGSSGSPLILAKKLKVIGIHNSGDEGENGRGKRNYAVPISRILKDLEENHPYIKSKLGNHFYN
jgi:hypothetical protein